MSEKLEWLKEKHKVKSEPAKRKSSAKEKSSKIIVKPEDYFPPQTVEQKQMKALEKIEVELEKNAEAKMEKKTRENELFEEVSDWAEQERARYNEMVKLQQKKFEADLETSQNYKKMSELVLKQAKAEFKEFQRKRDKNIRELEKQGITTSENSIFDTIREEALRKAKKDEKES